MYILLNIDAKTNRRPIEVGYFYSHPYKSNCDSLILKRLSAVWFASKVKDFDLITDKFENQNCRNLKTKIHYMDG